MFQSGLNLSGKLARRLLFLILLVVVLVLGAVTVIFAWPQPATASVSGSVSDVDGPVGGALVRVQTTGNHTYTAADGGFIIEGLSTAESVTLVAWAEGYIFGWTEARGGDSDVEIDLHRTTGSTTPSMTGSRRKTVESAIPRMRSGCGTHTARRRSTSVF